MGGRLLDYIAQGVAASRPLAADMPARIAVGGASIYYSTDTQVLNFFNAATVAWDQFIIATSLTTEEVQDIVGALIINGAGITVDYNDAAGTIEISSNVTQYTDENAMDIVAAMIALGTHIGITIFYDDATNSLSFTGSTVTQYTDEMAADAVGALLAAGADTGLTVVYDDAGNAITIAIIESTSTDMWTGTSSAKVVTPKKLWDAAIPTAVAYAAAVTLDGNTGVNFEIGNLTGAITLNNPTNFKPGQGGMIRFKQDATGNRVITYGANWKFEGGAAAAGVLSTAANKIDTLSYLVWNDGTIHCALGKDFS